MYRHILAPLDGSLLSAHVVSEAVELARVHGAHLTFLHVREDEASDLMSDAALLQTLTPERFAELSQWRIRMVLAKGAAGAKVRNVPHRSLCTTSNAPAEAIVAAARDEDCDLIVMATHGRGNALTMALGSVTLRVLQKSPVPVFVCGTGHSESTPAARAIAIIKDEHLSLLAVMEALHLLTERAGAFAEPGDDKVIEAILIYLREFPELLHHPKEEAYIFRRLAQRLPDCSPELTELRMQHNREKVLLNALEEVFAAYRGAPEKAPELREAAIELAEHVHMHFALGETAILPAARRCLAASDWEQIASAFAESGDPRFADYLEADFEALFARILQLADAPAGRARRPSN